MNIIKTNSLEIFKQNEYKSYDIGMVSSNAYLSVVVTNKCQCKCSYCINSKTDQSIELPIDKAMNNIKNLEQKYGIKEVILLGGEPTLHSDLFTLIKRLRVETNMIVRLTSNGIKLKDESFLLKLIHPEFGVHGLNISYHGIGSGFIPVSVRDMEAIYFYVKCKNPKVKVRVNTNVWKDNFSNIVSLGHYCNNIAPLIADEVRISNIIPKDDFSVNSKNEREFIGLTDNEYNDLFTDLCDYYSAKGLTLIENEKTLGFVRYILIPTSTPIILNWNIGSTVSDQICENNIHTREINTFKCLVNGEISLSWNENNIIK